MTLSPGLRSWGWEGRGASCSKPLAIPLLVMGVKEGTQAESQEVSRLTLLNLENVRLIWDIKIVKVDFLLWPEGPGCGAQVRGPVGKHSNTEGGSF